MTPIGEEIAIAVGNRLHVGQPLGGYIAAGALLLVTLFAFGLSWWLVSRHRPPSWATTIIFFFTSFILSWSGMWSWWIPSIFILIVLLIIVVKPKQAEVVAT